MLEASDEEQLSFAATDGRAMVTRNRNDYIALTVQFFEGLKPHQGLIIVPHTIPGFEFSRLATLLKKYSISHPRGMESYTIEFLTSNRNVIKEA